VKGHKAVKPRYQVVERDGKLWWQEYELDVALPKRVQRIHGYTRFSDLKQGSTIKLHHTIYGLPHGGVSAELIAEQLEWRFHLHRCSNCDCLFIGHHKAWRCAGCANQRKHQREGTASGIAARVVCRQELRDAQCCAQCSDPLPERHRSRAVGYCSAKCRQAAYRRRKVVDPISA
jgi:hypothetical protein